MEIELNPILPKTILDIPNAPAGYVLAGKKIMVHDKNALLESSTVMVDAEAFEGAGEAPATGNLTAAQLSALISNTDDNATVIATQVADKIVLSTNEKKDVAGGVLTFNGAKNIYFSKFEVEGLVAALRAELMPGGNAEIGAIIGRSSLIEWFSADYGNSVDATTTLVSTLTGRKDNMLTAPAPDSAVKRLTYNPTGAPGGKPSFVCAEPKVLTGNLTIPTTKDLVVWIVLKSTGTANTAPFTLEGFYDGELYLRAKNGNTLTAYQHGVGGYQEADVPMTNNAWHIVRLRAYRSEPTGQQLKVEVDGVASTMSLNQVTTDNFSSTLNLRFGAQTAAGNYGFAGEIGDLLIFNAKETDTEKATLNAFLKAKYGL